MPSPSLTASLLSAIGLLNAGSHDDGRRALEQLAPRLEEEGDSFHRCVLFHYLADVQNDPIAELRCDERALAEALVSDEQQVPAELAGLTLASFFPSLHLNLAADHRALGDLESAQRHVELASRCALSLPDTPLATLTRSAIERLALQLAAERRDR